MALLENTPETIVPRFLEKLKELVASVPIRIPSFTPHVIGQPIKVRELPAYGIVWQGLSQGSNFSMRRLRKGRIQFFYWNAIADDQEQACYYLMELQGHINRALTKRKQKYGILDVKPSLSQPSVSGADPNVVQIRDEYEVMLA